MSKIKTFLSWLLSFTFTLLITPWIMVMAIKLEFWPSLLTNHETNLILTIKGEKEELAGLKTIGDFVVIGVLSWLSPLWIGVFLWIALVVSYLFMWQVRALALPDENESIR